MGRWVVVATEGGMEGVFHVIASQKGVRGWMGKGGWTVEGTREKC